MFSFVVKKVTNIRSSKETRSNLSNTVKALYISTPGSHTKVPYKGYADHYKHVAISKATKTQVNLFPGPACGFIIAHADIL